MISIIVCGILLCTSVMIVSQGRDILRSIEVRDINTRLFFYLCLNGMINNICFSGMMVMKPSVARGCLNAVAWCSNVAFIGITVCLLAYLLDTERKKTELYTSVILYFGIIFYIVDIMLQGGIQHVVALHVISKYEAIFRSIFIIVLSLLYIYFVVSMIYSYRSRRYRKRERFIFRLVNTLCGITVIGILLEIASSMIPHSTFIPFQSVFMVATVFCLKKAYLGHQLLAIRREDYEEVLESNHHEPVVICDDEGTVVFINKCAMISIIDEKESVIGKKLVDLFDFSENGDFFTAHTGVFTVSGIYHATGRRCNLTIQNEYDTYGEVFTNIVTIYRLEYTNPVTTKETVIRDNQNGMDASEAVDVTSGALILLVDDSPSALALLEGAMKPYQMNIEKAFSGSEAIHLLTEGKRYDMLFIDHLMPNMDGIETAKQIRSLEGDYFSQVPIVFCSATNIEENLSEFLKVRFNDFLSKPVSIKELSDILTRWLWNRASMIGLPKEEPQEVLHMSAGLDIEGIDEGLAAKYIGDNKEMYFTLLKNFLNDMKEMITDLERNYEHYDRMRFRILTHAMFSACKGIGALELSERADRLEQACIQEDNQYISDQIEHYVKDFRDLLKHIASYLQTSAG